MAKIIASTYEIIKEIGSGGGGIVYLANHLRLEKKVILKADKRKITTRSELLRREVDILKELNHEYIPQVYDFFIEDEIVYTVIDYIEGESLDRPLKRGETFSQAQIIKWAIQILEALDYLHSPTHGEPPKGYVHSDIKPANIMKKSNGNICLIDFNIALALGEKNAIGCSKGYASPEHYGLDFSTESGQENSELSRNGTGTEILPMARIRGESNRIRTSSVGSSSSGSMEKRLIIPDVRSDIYSLGATLYHLLSGSRPASNAKDVKVLSEKEYSTQIVAIITKAMNPNPDLRYQSAAEMMDALLQLHHNDIRSIRWRRRNRGVYSTLVILLLAGVICTFVGLKRMQASERWLRITEDARKKYQSGAAMDALKEVMQVYSEKEGLLTPKAPPQARQLLTEVLGVYDLEDGFDVYKTVELPSAILDMQVSHNSRTAACICSGALIVIDLENAEILYKLPADKSALAEVEYLNDNEIVYAGKEGIVVYDIENASEKWQGERATGISVSDDRKRIAAIYRDESYAQIYDSKTGDVVARVDFSGKKQSVLENDIFINPSDSIFELNSDGSMLAVSFSDGSLRLFDVQAEAETGSTEILDRNSGYNHYEGGFYQNYFAFSAANKEMEESVFAVIDVCSMEQVGGFSSEGYYFADADENGIVVGIDNILVTLNPETGEQRPLVDTAERITKYSFDGTFTMITAEERVYIFDSLSNEICSLKRTVGCDQIRLQGDKALIGSSDSPILWIARYENHPEREMLKYDAAYVHDEARISNDEKTAMLFSYTDFRIYDLEDGEIISEVFIPNADQVYDQQYVRDSSYSYLEVIYSDGLTVKYDASTGKIVESRNKDEPDMTLYEEFETSRLRVESPLHGTPKVYDRKTGKFIADLSDDAYLTYISEIGDYVVAQYVTADSKYYGYLMNQECEVLAYLPYLCDVLENSFVFDYPSGYIREEKIYELEELKMLAGKRIEEEKKNEN